MKQLIACFLLLLLVAPVWAADDADDEEFGIHEMIVISVKNEDASLKEMSAILKALQQRIENPQVLGNAAGRVKVERISSLVLSDFAYSTKQYPQFKNYQYAVRDLYNELLKIKASDPEFAEKGWSSKGMMVWGEKLKAAEAKFKNLKHPGGAPFVLSGLHSLAGHFISLRRGTITLEVLNSAEETISNDRALIDRLSLYYPIDD